VIATTSSLLAADRPTEVNVTMPCQLGWFFGAALCGGARFAGCTLALEVAEDGGFERDLEVQTGNVASVRVARSRNERVSGSIETSRNRRFGA
jgi:hypothetical protein